ncbi:hypothetical protein PV10_06866 [Exophiala mesophila]|uniref:Heterokaryon incompatibility domain-containing protein n=1 Tax=Exophiala mesophila TaxID=212818 RepID=A0A0D1Z6F8_EXOME|nr:uncharacterized protein PV10_06866 [Exophiala mesophila]KIV89469.1 hypothetical protein PV10_06866 [Exophiala mesophila]
MTVLTLCQFQDDGLVERHDVDIDTTRYLAISHIWAKAEWRDDIPNIPWKVLASPHKAAFLADEFKQLVGREFFWMDILCVDQAVPDERIRVVRHIPNIYRGAAKTIVIREPGGFAKCCADAMTADGNTWMNGARENFQRHMRTSHYFHPLAEPWFDRLWVLQEAVLSDTIQFTICGHVEHEDFDVEDDLWGYATRFKQLTDHLQATAYSWISYGVDQDGSDQEYNEFVHAFLHNGVVTRKTADVDRHRRRSGIAEIDVHLNSMRQTTKARDFILAIFPQFGWYVPPENVRTMAFGQLWLDLCRQASQAGYAFLAHVTRGMVSDSPSADASRLATDNVPTPQVLGDFVSMLGSPAGQQTFHWGLKVSDVTIDERRPAEVSDLLRIIRESMNFNQKSWFFASRGSLNLYGSYPRTVPSPTLLSHVSSDRPVSTWTRDEDGGELDEEKEAVKALNAMWLGLFEENAAMGGDWNYYSQWLSMRCSTSYADRLLRLAALISCGFGMSAYEWSTTVFIPVIVTVKSCTILGLLSRGYYEAQAALTEVEDNSEAQAPTDTNQEDDDLVVIMQELTTEDGAQGNEAEMEASFFCAQRGMDYIGQDMVLVEPGTNKIIGILPDFVDHVRSPEEFADRYLELCEYPQTRLLVDVFARMDTIFLE